MDNKILLTNIQRFSLHDGPGIRTTIFLKGCSLRCPWCSNPENLSTSVQKYERNGQKGVYGIYYSTEELYAEIIKDKVFYESNSNEYDIKSLNQIEQLPGGITFSGGECLLQMKAMLPLLKRLNAEHIHIAAETCLFAEKESLKIAMEFINLFYVDVKILDKRKCNNYLHGDLELYLLNLHELMCSGKPVIIRVPVIGGYTDDKKNREMISELICRYVETEKSNLLKVELIKEHNLAISKYESLHACNEGYDTPDYNGVSIDLMIQYKNEISKSIKDMIPIEICKI
jgi:pyruvate formate lyase activating enzyme